VDFVSQESELAGRGAGDYLTGRRPPADNIRLAPGDNVSYCVPHTVSSDREHTVYLRVRRTEGKCTIKFGDVYAKKLLYVFPAEMVTITLRPKFLQEFHGDTLRVDVVAR